MALRCLLFSSDEGTALPVCQALAGLDIEADYCAAAVEAVARVTGQSFQIVIVDWDNQPEAGLLLNTARERKASERPLTLAIVSNDANVSQALQAGANSILRKPIQPNLVRDTLTTARDLLRSRFDSAAPAAQAAAAAASGATMGPLLSDDGQAPKKTLRAGEFLQAVIRPGAQFDIESETKNSFGQVAASEIDALKDLAPMAASVETKRIAPDHLPEPSEPRGLEWYMKARAGTLPSVPSQPPAPAKADLLGYEQTPSRNHASPPTSNLVAGRGGSPEQSEKNDHEQKTEAVLFAYMSGESSKDSVQAEGKVRPGLSKALCLIAFVAVCGVSYVTVPRSFWHQKVGMLLGHVVHAGHNWLNPQTPTPAQAPTSHENFGRAGDEYKLPVAENIPDATTDPSQIRVLPVLDPTAKQPPNASANAAPALEDTTPAAANTADQAQPTPAPVQEDSPSPAPPANPLATGDQPVSPPPQPPPTTAVSETAHPDVAPVQSVAPAQRARVQPVPQKPPTRTISTVTPAGIPSSLRSQMASMTPNASGNKPAEAALPSIEPVELSEATARSLLLQQADPVYPETAKGQKGTVVLQVLIGRDGTVQDAKFLQGSLAFARTAIDTVKQWRFKPFTMNGRPTSAQTLLTLNFKPSA